MYISCLIFVYALSLVTAIPQLRIPKNLKFHFPPNTVPRKLGQECVGDTQSSNCESPLECIITDLKKNTKTCQPGPQGPNLNAPIGKNLQTFKGAPEVTFDGNFPQGFKVAGNGSFDMELNALQSSCEMLKQKCQQKAKKKKEKKKCKKEFKKCVKSINTSMVQSGGQAVNSTVLNDIAKGVSLNNTVSLNTTNTGNTTNDALNQSAAASNLKASAASNKSSKPCSQSV